MKKYPWSVNDLKLQRAIAQASKESVLESGRDERVKELYISFGGKVLSEEEATKEDVVAEKVEDVKEDPEAEPILTSTSDLAL